MNGKCLRILPLLKLTATHAVPYEGTDSLRHAERGKDMVVLLV